MPTMIKIFVASSNELKDERDELAVAILTLNGRPRRRWSIWIRRWGLTTSRTNTAGSWGPAE